MTLQNYDNLTQRETYKLVENMTNGKFESELDFLKSLIRDVVSHEDFKINGGRLWVLEPTQATYSLDYQYGTVKEIEPGYKIVIQDQPILRQLAEKHSLLNYESDPVLIKKGIELYSVTGVGDIIKMPDGKYFQYVIGFNAPEITQTFIETLNIISSVATISLRDLNSKLKQAKFRRDLDKASEIQRNLLPEHYLEFHDYKIFGTCLPESEVGGDYFDYLQNVNLDEDRMSIVVSDAASKGLSAAIQSLFVSGAIRMATAFSQQISSIMSHLNTLIYETFPYERFVTLFYCELSLSSNRLVLYVNCGHCAPVHYRPGTNTATLLEPTGGLLGIVQHQKFNIENITMQPGDILAIYTDGITEAQDSEGELYGEERLMEVIKKYHSLSSRDINYKILEDVQQFSAKSVYSDDKTLVVIKRDLS